MSTKNINFDMKKGKKNEKRIEKLIEYQIGSLDKTITRKKKIEIFYEISQINKNSSKRLGR